MAQGVKLSEDVLPVDQFVAWREEGLSFAAIGKRIGYSGGAVGAYGGRVLPEHLQGRRAGEGKRAKSAAADNPLQRLEQIKAEIREEREMAEERKRRELAEVSKREDQEKRAAVAAVRDKVESKAGEISPPEKMPERTHRPLNFLGRFRGEISPPEKMPERTVPRGTVFAAGSLHGPLVITALCGVADTQYLAEKGGDGDAWDDFLLATDPDLLKFKGLVEMTPPPYVRTDDDRLMYLRYVAAGRAWVRGGRRVRRQLRRILVKIGYPVLSLGTVRLLDVLASAALWLIEREGADGRR